MNEHIKGFLSFSFGTWLRFIISFFTAPIISYLIVPEEYGKSSMFGLVSSILMVVLLMGIDEGFMRFYHEFEENRRSDLFVTIVLFSLFNITLSSIVILTFSSKISIALYGENYPIANFVLLMSLLVSVFQKLINLTFRMEKRGIVFSFGEVLSTIFGFFGTLLYILFIKRNFFAILFGGLVGSIVSFVYALSKFNFKYLKGKFSIKILKNLLVYSIPYLPTYLFVWLMNAIDRITLRQYSTFSEIGIYSTAFKLVATTQIITTGFFNYWFPLSYEVYEKNSADLSFFRRANKFTSFMMFLLGLLALTFKDLFFLIFSKSYREASYVAPFLILIPVTSVIHQTVIIGINLSKKPYMHFFMAVISALANYFGNLLLVPILGAKGAAISTGLSHILLYFIGMWLSERTFYIGFEKKRPLIAICFLVLQSVVGTLSNIHWIFNMLTGITFIIFLIRIYKDEFETLLYKNILPFVKTKFS